MPATQGGQPFDDLARRWHDLADRRLAYFAELHRGGRWRLYYRTEQQFAARMLDVIEIAKTWARLAGRKPRADASPVRATAEPSVVPRAALPSRAEMATAPKPDRLRSAA